MFDAAIQFLSKRIEMRAQGITGHSVPGKTPFVDPKMVSYWAKRTAQYTAHINLLAKAITNGSVANPVFKEIGYWLNQGLENAWEAEHTGYDQPSLYRIPGMLKKAKAGTSEHEFLTVMLPLATAYNTLKTTPGMVVKRQPKAVEDVKAKYLAPRAGNDARALIQRALMAITEKHYTTLLANIISYYQRSVTSLLDDLGRTANGVFTSNEVRAYLSKHKLRYDDMLYSTCDMKPAKREEVIVKTSTREAEFIRDQFIIKNMKKFQAIVDAKKNFTAITPLGNSIDMNNLEGRFLLTFADGASFEANNKVVWGRSVYGKAFHRFPLTFHNVKLADGSKMGKPSEERMNTIFVGKV